MNLHIPLHWQTLRLSYVVESGGWVGRHKGSAWRGMLGHVLRQYNLGLYYRLFENKVSPQHPLARRFRQGPVPYVLNAPNQEREFVERGETLDIELTLVGTACEQFPLLAPLLDKLGADWGPDHARCTWTGLSLLPEQGWGTGILPAATEQTGSLRLTLTSPWVRGKSEPPGWPDLVAALAERCRLLSHFFCQAELIEDAPAWRLLGQEAQVRNLDLSLEALERYSARQGGKMNLKGWTATWEISELPPALAPLLASGEVLGVGKGAAWGLGRFRTEPMAPAVRFSTGS